MIAVLYVHGGRGWFYQHVTNRRLLVIAIVVNLHFTTAYLQEVLMYLLQNPLTVVVIQLLTVPVSSTSDFSESKDRGRFFQYAADAL